MGRGIKVNDGLVEIRETTSVSTLLEVAFHDNQEDATWIINNIDNIADAIFIGIEKYFENN
ncbi:hypothetical protein D3C81_2050440 [compost metagenome]